MTIPVLSPSSPSDIGWDSKPHLFRLSDEVLGCFDIDDVAATYDDMVEMGLNKDPYDYYCIELATPFLLNYAKFIGMESGNYETAMESAKGWTWCFYYMVFEETDSYSAEIFIKIPTGQMFNYGQLCRDAVEEDETFERTITIIEESLKCFLIMLLATKNIDKKTVENSKRAISPKSKKDSKYYSHTTTLKIGKITESYGSANGTGGAKRPHLRRGHIRTQRFGKGNAEVKKIFIQPVFVNADETWVNEQKTYRVVA
jgi:hypothetical protein